MIKFRDLAENDIYVRPEDVRAIIAPTLLADAKQQFRVFVEGGIQSVVSAEEAQKLIDLLTVRNSPGLVGDTQTSPLSL